MASAGADLGTLSAFMDEEEIAELKARIAALETEHRDLDDIVARLAGELYVDQLQLRRLKKRKLLLKDQLERLRSRLIPDLDA